MAPVTVAVVPPQSVDMFHVARGIVKERIEIPCKTCGKMFNRINSRSAYCGDSCRPFKLPDKDRRHKKVRNCIICNAEINSAFQTCEAHLGRRLPLESLKRPKKALIEKRGHRCENKKCHRTTWCGEQIPLELDHIDGNPDNNDVSNLRLLCPNCHAMTETYKGRNVGRFPNSRRALMKRR